MELIFDNKIYRKNNFSCRRFALSLFICNYIGFSATCTFASQPIYWDSNNENYHNVSIPSYIYKIQFQEDQPNPYSVTYLKNKLIEGINVVQNIIKQELRYVPYKSSSAMSDDNFIDEMDLRSISNYATQSSLKKTEKNRVTRASNMLFYLLSQGQSAAKKAMSYAYDHPLQALAFGLATQTTAVSAFGTRNTNFGRQYNSEEINLLQSNTSKNGLAPTIIRLMNGSLDIIWNTNDFSTNGIFSRIIGPLGETTYPQFAVPSTLYAQSLKITEYENQKLLYSWQNYYAGANAIQIIKYDLSTDIFSSQYEPVPRSDEYDLMDNILLYSTHQNNNYTVNASNLDIKNSLIKQTIVLDSIINNIPGNFNLIRTPQNNSLAIWFDGTNSINAKYVYDNFTTSNQFNLSMENINSNIRTFDLEDSFSIIGKNSMQVSYSYMRLFNYQGNNITNTIALSVSPGTPIENYLFSNMAMVRISNDHIFFGAGGITIPDQKSVIFGQILNNYGELVSNTFSISDNATVDDNNPSFVSTQNGGVMAVWQRKPAQGVGPFIYGRYLSPIFLNSQLYAPSQITTASNPPMTSAVPLTTNYVSSITTSNTFTTSQIPSSTTGSNTLTTSQAPSSTTGSDALTTSEIPSSTSSNTLTTSQIADEPLSTSGAPNNTATYAGIGGGVGGTAIISGIGGFFIWKNYKNKKKNNANQSEVAGLELEAQNSASRPQTVRPNSLRPESMGPNLVAAQAFAPSKGEGIREARMSVTGNMYGQVYGLYFQVDEEEAQEITAQSGLPLDYPSGQSKMDIVLGKGNFGQVRLARAESTAEKEFVALKIVAGEKSVNSSLREGQIQSRLNGSENVLPLLEYLHYLPVPEKKREIKKLLKKTFGQTTLNGQDMMMQPLLLQITPLAAFGNGDTFKAKLSAINDRRLKNQLINHFTLSLLNGLKNMHNKGVSHLDLKPSNLLIHTDGTIYIGDFGCSQQKDYIIGGIGDTRYFSPERLAHLRFLEKQRGQMPIINELADKFSGKAADVWAVGITLLEVVNNSYPLESMGPSNMLRTWDAKRYQEMLTPTMTSQTDEMAKLAKDSPSTISLINKLLNTDAKKRISVSDAWLMAVKNFDKNISVPNLYQQLKVNVTTQQYTSSYPEDMINLYTTAYAQSGGQYYNGDSSNSTNLSGETVKTNLVVEDVYGTNLKSYETMINSYNSED